MAVEYIKIQLKMLRLKKDYVHAPPPSGSNAPTKTEARGGGGLPQGENRVRHGHHLQPVSQRCLVDRLSTSAIVMP